MSPVENTLDVIDSHPNYNLSIDLVGLRQVKIPIRLNSKFQNSAELSLLISLDSKKNRGIHMSRLYFILHEQLSKNKLSFSVLKNILQKSIQSQKGLSSSGRIQLKSHWPVLKPALKSSLKGWREYPFYYEIQYFKKTKKWSYIAGTEVLYSSTCPCSALLSSQVMKQDFLTHFSSQKNLSKSKILKYMNSDKFLSATPHAQKSSAFLKLKLKESAIKNFSILKTINQIEKSLGTAVQTAVRREDEAEFARRNAKNLMFCEDAVRRLGFLFKDKKEFLDYVIRVQHYESLHPFDVESVITKGIKNGWRA